MELHKEILFAQLGKIVYEALRPQEIDYSEVVDGKSAQALQKIKAIIENDGLSDFECIEQIVRIFEELGSGCGNRHDFG